MNEWVSSVNAMYLISHQFHYFYAKSGAKFISTQWPKRVVKFKRDLFALHGEQSKGPDHPRRHRKSMTAFSLKLSKLRENGNILHGYLGESPRAISKDHASSSEFRFSQKPVKSILPSIPSRIHLSDQPSSLI
jgi:hypothetical protein